MGYTSTVAAFTILGATQDSMSVMKVKLCSNGIFVNTQTNAHAPVPIRLTTNCWKCNFFFKKFNITNLKLITLNLRKIGNFPTRLIKIPMRTRQAAYEISNMRLCPNVSCSSSVMHTYFLVNLIAIKLVNWLTKFTPFTDFTNSMLFTQLNLKFKDFTSIVYVKMNIIWGFHIYLLQNIWMKSSRNNTKITSQSNKQSFNVSLNMNMMLSRNIILT